MLTGYSIKKYWKNQYLKASTTTTYLSFDEFRPARYKDNT